MYLQNPGIKNFLFTFLLSFGLIIQAFGQEVEHNYEMGPQKTSCDSLNINQLTDQEQIEIIRNTSFRIDRNFRLTRTSGFQGGEFHSCDGKMGYLIIKADNMESLFDSIPKSTWDELVTSPDPEGYYIHLRDSLNASE